jgi:filamentous hemagglutinin
MGLFTNPLGHAGYPPGVTGTPTTLPSAVRAATAAEAAAGVLTDCYISPATADSATALDFASPPVLGFGSTTPRPVHATTLEATGTVDINDSGAGVTTIGTGGTGAVNIGNATGNTAVTGSLTASAGLVATTGGVTVNGGDIINSHSDAGTDVTIEVTNSDNTNGASRAGVEVAVGGASGGDPYLSFQISGVGASTMTMGLDNSASDLFVISNSGAIGTSNALTLSQAGALTATTSITATLGDITATNGNIVRGTAGNKDMYSSVASTATAVNNSAGTVTLVGGTETVTTTAVTAASQIRLYRQGIGATGAAALGILTLGTIVAGTSFVINSVQAADATALQASDVSVIGWEIVN